MAVVSVSLPSDLVDAVDARPGGRSAVVRTALRDHLQRAEPKAAHLHGSITLFYPHGEEARVSEARHAHHDVVLSMMHTHCEPQTCMDVLVVGGPRERVLALRDDLERMRTVSQVRLITQAGS